MSVTPIMGIPLPTVLQTLEPGGSQEMIDAIANYLDGHDHLSVGKLIRTLAILIDADLPINSFNVVGARSYGMNNNNSPLALLTDINRINVVNGDLYYNNAAGVSVRITSGSGLFLGSVTLNAFAQHSINNTLTILPADTYVNILVDTNGARVINLPAANGVSAGRIYLIKDVTGLAATNNITINRAGSDTIDNGSTSAVIATNYGGLFVIADGVSNFQVYRFVTDNHKLTSLVASGAITANGVLTGNSIVSTTSTTTATLSATTSATSPLLIATTSATSPFFQSSASNPAAAGLVRGVNNSTLVSVRNAAHSADVNVAKISSANKITLGENSTTSTDLSIVGNDLDMTTPGNITISGDSSVTVVSDSGTTINSTGGDTTISASGTVVLSETTGTTLINGSLFLQTRAVSGDLTIDTTTTDLILNVTPNGKGGGLQINLTLPAPSAGRVIIIQDVNGSANANPIILLRHGSEKINNLASSKTLSAAYGRWVIESNGTDWWL